MGGVSRNVCAGGGKAGKEKKGGGRREEETGPLPCQPLCRARLTPTEWVAAGTPRRAWPRVGPGHPSHFHWLQMPLVTLLTFTGSRCHWSPFALSLAPDVQDPTLQKTV